MPCTPLFSATLPPPLRNLTTSIQHLSDMHPAVYNPVPIDEVPETRPNANSPRHINEETELDPNRRSFLSMDGFLVSCIFPPCMGFSFVALGFYIIYGHTTLVISHSTKHVALIGQAFTAISAMWHFIALIPAISAVQKVRSEEWWRRLLKTASFNRVNSVSSNVSGAFAHTIEIIFAWSSQYFKSAWIVTLITVVLADIAPAAIQVKIGSNTVPASFLVPALPPNSIYSNYSKPFRVTDNRVHPSIDIAPVYYKASAFSGTHAKAAPPSINALVPRPNIIPGQGYRYLTDVYVHFSVTISASQ